MWGKLIFPVREFCFPNFPPISGGILGKSDKNLFIRFHLLSKMQNTPFQENLILLISPVATVKTDDN